MAQYIKDNGEWVKIGGVEKYPAEFGTRAEFEAKKDSLPVGTVFTTTDEFEQGEKDIYSTDEVKTNKVWIDGKPIYRRVVNISSITTSGLRYTGVVGIESIINYYGYCLIGASKRPIPFISKDMNAVMIQLYDSRFIQIESAFTCTDLHIAIEYTKTN